MGKKIPDSHRDLLAGPVNVVLTTIMPDGQIAYELQPLRAINSPLMQLPRTSSSL